MEQSYRKIFWGVLITLFNINIGTVNLLPNFLGYLIISSGLVKIIEEFENKNFQTAYKASNLLFLYSLITSIVYFLGFNENSGISYKNIIDIGLSIIVSLFGLIMSFNILSGTIDLFFSRDQGNQANNVLKSQRIYTILFLFGLILISFSFNISNEMYLGLSAVYLIFVQLYFAIIISEIRKHFLA